MRRIREKKKRRLEEALSSLDKKFFYRYNRPINFVENIQENKIGNTI